MSLYKRSGSPFWWTRFSISGRRVRESTGTADKAQAEEYETHARTRAWREARLGEVTHTWKDAATRWKVERATKRSAWKDEQMLEWFAGTPELLSLPLAEITPDVIAQARAKLSEGLSPNTVNKYMALMRSILKIAVEEWGWLTSAPKVPMYSLPKTDPRWITREQFGRLVKHLPTHQADIARIAVLTGLRRFNITGLTWDRIDLKRKTAFIPSSQAKGAKGIAVPLSDEAVRVLKRWTGQHDTYVFVFRGKPVYQLVTKAWRDARTAAGLPGLKFHDLRHTWASWQVQADTPLQAVQALGGWASPAMVQRYAHLSPGQLSQYAGAVRLGTLVGHTGPAKRKPPSKKRTKSGG